MLCTWLCPVPVGGKIRLVVLAWDGCMHVKEKGISLEAGLVSCVRSKGGEDRLSGAVP